MNIFERSLAVNQPRPEIPSLTVVVLTYNEEIHIERCLKSIHSVSRRIIVVDSFSTDRTVNLAKSLGAEVVQHKFKNYADQFQWALDNHTFDTDWIMRLDADEYPESGLISEIREKFPKIPNNVDGIYLKLKVLFMGKWIRYGGIYPHVLLRIWRAGKGRIEQRWMDEHIVLQSGANSIVFQEHFVNDNKKGITFWTNKHNSYASREMADVLIKKYSLLPVDVGLRQMNEDPQAQWKRLAKEELYYKLPLVFRPFLYFFYRYFIKLGFLDGGRGFIWHFLQGCWYRILVDVKLIEVEEKAMGDSEEVRRLMQVDYGIDL